MVENIRIPFWVRQVDMEFTEGCGMTLSRAGQPENQARAWTEPGPLERSREQACVAVFRATHFSSPPCGFPVSSECLVGSHSATLTDSPLRRSTEKRGASPQRLVEKPSPEARDVDTQQVEQRQGSPLANGHRLPCQHEMSFCEP